MTQIPINFDVWMQLVDMAVRQEVSCSAYDLEDYCFRDAYDNGESPTHAALLAVDTAYSPKA